MQFCRFLAVVCFLNFRTEAAREKVPSAFDEIQRRDSACTCSDATSLLDKLIIELENMKGQILHEMPQQLAMQAEEIQKLRDDVKGIDMKMTDGFKDVKEELKEAIIQEIMKSVNHSDSACNDHPYLRKIESSVENVDTRTKEISESLQTHDQRLQTLTDITFCLNNIGLCDCSTIKTNGNTASGVYRIYVDHLGKRYYANVYCDMITGNDGWTIFQRRKDGSVDFFRGWSDYENGFGDPNGEFWLGNNFLHLLTTKRRYRLRIDLEDFEGGKRYVEYSTFNISSSADKYRLRLENYSGTAGGNSLHWNNGMRFTTKDSDNDADSSRNCAIAHQGAWWYNDCAYSNLNGLYLRGSYSSNGSFHGWEGILWYDWRSIWYSLKMTEMKITSS